jgi:acrylyl-CoA reductase (NADPH)
MTMKALLVEKDADGKNHAAVQEIDEARLPEGNAKVAVEYSTLNYKDGLCIGSGGGLVRTYPHVPGIDFAGTIEASDDPPPARTSCSGLSSRSLRVSARCWNVAA